MKCRACTPKERMQCTYLEKDLVAYGTVQNTFVLYYMAPPGEGQGFKWPCPPWQHARGRFVPSGYQVPAHTRMCHALARTHAHATPTPASARTHYALHTRDTPSTRARHALIRTHAPTRLYKPCAHAPLQHTRASAPTRTRHAHTRT